MRKFIVLTGLIYFGTCFSQTCSELGLQLVSETETSCFTQTMTILHDRMDRNYLYVANKENGLTIYDITQASSPTLVQQITRAELENLDVMNLSQKDNYLYLALGNTFNTNENAGLAIINVTDPENAFVEDTYVHPNSNGGSGVVKTEGNFAYLGAMQNGLLILDISNQAAIQFVSQYVPQINWPDVTQDPQKVNARGMEIRNDTLFLCYDAGGFRIIDVTSKTQPQEIGRFANEALTNLPRAYNNLSLSGNLAYIAVDYCGLEILDFSDLQNIQLKGWWNPYNCPTNNWFTSPVHANEIRLDDNCKQIYLSTGKSDMIVVDVSNPIAPDSCNFYGGNANNIGTWGIDVYKNKVFLSYICTFGIPFTSNWSGFKILTKNTCSLVVKEVFQTPSKIFPNPAQTQLHVQANDNIKRLSLKNLAGKIVYQLENVNDNQVIIELDNFEKAYYFLEIEKKLEKEVVSFVKN